METAKYFDVHDKDITPAIYTLLFCGAFVEIDGNDKWYEIHPMEDNSGWHDGWEDYDNGSQVIRGQTEHYSSSREFKERIAQGWNNCYHDEEAMKKFCNQPCTCAEAIAEFKQWLAAKGVKGDDMLFVKIWW
jgi:hypothetical protein